MTAHFDHRVWQDVYHAPTPVGKEAYIKLTMRGEALVIQFKERKMKRADCPNCGSREWKPFQGETFETSHRGLTAKEKGLAGWRCGSCDEVVFDKPSAGRYAAAGDQLVMAARTAERAEIRRIRRKLGLTQAAAAEIMGGGHNAFSRYERGEAAPLPAVMNLLRLLDRHPELLRELTEAPRV